MSVLDSYLIYRYIIINIGQVHFRAESSNYESYDMALFQLHFLQNVSFWMRMAPGQGHLCSIDTFLVLFLHENICCGYSLEAPYLGTSYYPQIMLWRNQNYLRITTNYSS